MSVQIIVGDALERLRELPDESVHACITSPPYFGLRSYGGEPGMIGLEPTFDEHLEALVAVFREVRRVLRGDGCLFVNYGDAYAGGRIQQSCEHGGALRSQGGKQKHATKRAWLEAQRPDDDAEPRCDGVAG